MLLPCVLLVLAVAPAAGAGSDVVRENLCEFLPQEVGGAELAPPQRRDFTDCVATYQLGTPSSDGQTPVHTFSVWIASPQWGDIDGLFEDDEAELAGGSIGIGDRGLAGVDAAETGPVEEYVVAFRRADLYVNVKTFLGPYEGRPALSASELSARSEALARAIDANIAAATPISPSTEDDPGAATPSADDTREGALPQPSDGAGDGIPPEVIIGVVVLAAAGVAVANRGRIGRSRRGRPPPPDPPPPEPPGPGRYPRGPGDKAEPRVGDRWGDGFDPEDTESGTGHAG